MIKTSIILIVLICFTACKSTNRPETEGKNTHNYPYIIDSLGADSLYNDVRWAMYCIYSDAKVKMDTSKTYGMLPLKLEHVNLFRDTLELYLCFSYEGNPIHNSRHNRYEFVGGIGIQRSVSKIIYYILDGDIKATFMDKCLDSNNCNDRFVKPLQPEVIQYIKHNKEKLDPWFRLEAIKRGIIK